MSKGRDDPTSSQHRDNRLAIVALAMLAFFQGSPVMADDAETLALARDVADDLVHSRFSALREHMSPPMQTTLSEAQLAETWASLVSRFGPVSRVGAPQMAANGNSSNAIVPLTFSRGALDLEVAARNGKLEIFRLKPHVPASSPWTEPTYADPAASRDVEVRIGREPSALPGILSFPIAGTKHPVVILVHGSGPNDRDESIGPNRPFRDLAAGLAARGIAVLRYDKRTKVFPDQFAPAAAFTVREEVTDDVDAAIDLLVKRPDIDAERIVVLGHSLGGMLAPRIAASNRRVSALVLLAAAARRLPDIMVEQVEYLMRIGPGVDQIKLAQIKSAAAAARAAKTGDTGANILGAPPSYWADLNAYDPAATAASLTIPILVMQGTRDYQVTSEDAERFSTALKDQANARVIMLPGLNHLFIAGQGPATPEEYEVPGHVAGEVIDRIAAFVAQLRR